MNIAFLAHDKRKELMVQFCVAHRGVLAHHNLCATASTGRLIAKATGLPVALLLSHKQGGHQQINARIAYNEIDMVVLFSGPDAPTPEDDQILLETVHLCDRYNIPLATNLAAAETMMLGLQRNNSDWQEVLLDRSY